MPKYRIEIIQQRAGYVDIEAGSEKEASEIAERLYNEEGHELPDMDDISELIINVQSPDDAAADEAYRQRYP